MLLFLHIDQFESPFQNDLDFVDTFDNVSDVSLSNPLTTPKLRRRTPTSRCGRRRQRSNPAGSMVSRGRDRRQVFCGQPRQDLESGHDHDSLPPNLLSFSDIQGIDEGLISNQPASTSSPVEVLGDHTMALSTKMIPAGCTTTQSADPDNNRLVILGLSLYTTEQELRKEFSKFGPLEEVKIVRDGISGRSRGFAFTYFKSSKDAKTAKEAMNGRVIDGRRIQIEFSINQNSVSPVALLVPIIGAQAGTDGHITSDGLIPLMATCEVPAPQTSPLVSNMATQATSPPPTTVQSPRSSSASTSLISPRNLAASSSSASTEPIRAPVVNNFWKKNDLPKVVDTAKLVKCKTCDQFFSNVGNMNRHFHRVHEQKSFKCTICPKSYGCKNGLKFHINNVHETKPLKIACDFCGKIWKHRGMLYKHSLYNCPQNPSRQKNKARLSQFKK